MERVSQQVNILGNEKYIDELFEIIRNVTKYHIEYNKVLDNYRTWWYFVKILLNIPNDKIPLDIIEFIPVWLDSRFDNAPHGADIATKLLPKLLDSDNPEDWEKVEKIIESITAIKWVPLPEKSASILGKKEEPRTVLDAYWILESFKANAIKIGKKCSENIIYDLANKLKEIFKREHESHQIDIELDNETYRIKAIRIQDEKSSFKDFDFHFLAGRLKKSELEKKDVKNDLFKIISLEPEALFDFELEDCQNEESFKERIKQELLKKDRPVDLTKFRDIDKKLGNLYNGLHSDYSYIWFKSLASGPRIGISETNRVLTVILRDILLAKCKLNKKIGRAILDKFLGEEYQFPLFRRLVLLAVSNNWNEYKNLFWRFLEDHLEALNESDYEVELYKL